MELSQAQKDFIVNLWVAANEICPQYNIKAIDGIVAQACLESGYGSSSLASKYHNYFGMKCGANWVGRSVNLATKEEYSGQVVNIRDNFRVFADVKDGIRGYCNFIVGYSRYSNLLGVEDAREYITRLKNDGWATDSKYIDKVCSIVPVVQETMKDVFEYLDAVNNGKVEQPKAETTDTYVVVKGDTLSGIAKKFNTSVAKLVSLNGLSNPDLIYPGQTLRVTETGGAIANTYTIAKGDTLSGIAKKFGTTVKALQELNGIANANKIYAGQTIRIS